MFNILWIALQFSLECWVSLYPYQPVESYDFFRSVDIFLTWCFISSVWLIIMIDYFLSSAEIGVGLDVSKTVAGSFRCLTIKIMPSGFCNYRRTYCFIFFMDLLYCSLDYICSELVPNTVPKLSTSPLKFRMYGVYGGRFKIPPHPSRPWWSHLPPQPHRPCPWPPLLLFYYLIIMVAWVVFASLLSPQFLPTAGGAVSVYLVIVIDLFLSG